MISPVVGGEPVGEQRDARLGDRLGVLDVPAERRALDPDVLELLEAGDALRRDACGSGRRATRFTRMPCGPEVAGEVARGRLERGLRDAHPVVDRPGDWRRCRSRGRRSSRRRSISGSARDRERLQRVRRHLQRDGDVVPRRVEEAAAEARLGREADRVQHAVELAADVARRARRGASASVTSSSTISGSASGAAWRRAAVRLIARPNDVSTTSAPCSCASARDRERDRRVVEHAGDEDPLALRAALVVLGSDRSERRVGVAARPAAARAWCASTSSASASTRRVSRGVDHRRRRSRARRRRTGWRSGPRTRSSASCSVSRSASSSIAASWRPCRICTAPGAPITAISARRPRDAQVVAEVLASP